MTTDKHKTAWFWRWNRFRTMSGSVNETLLYHHERMLVWERGRENSNCSYSKIQHHIEDWKESCIAYSYSIICWVETVHVRVYRIQNTSCVYKCSYYMHRRRRWVCFFFSFSVSVCLEFRTTRVCVYILHMCAKPTEEVVN